MIQYLNYLFLFMLILYIYYRIYYGGAKRSRTVDLLRARQALYQLSYGPVYNGRPGQT